MTRDEIEALCDQLTYRPVGTTAAQMREAAALLLAQQLELADLRQYHDWAAPQIERPIEQHIVDKINDVTADRDRLAAELAECRRDAERYRWLRGRCEDYDGGCLPTRYRKKAELLCATPGLSVLAWLAAEAGRANPGRGRTAILCRKK